MDRGAWQATVHGVSIFGRDLAMKLSPPHGISVPFSEKKIVLYVSSKLIKGFQDSGYLPWQIDPWSPCKFQELRRQVQFRKLDTIQVCLI